jgi:arylformamidase
MGPCGCDELIFNERCIEKSTSIVVTTLRPPDLGYLSAFSSGSHLAGVALLTDWKKDYDLPGDVIKGAVLSSGLYDLKAVRLSARSKYVNITDEIEEALSTQRHLAKIRTPLVLAHGTYETPEFQRRTRDFAAALKAVNKPEVFHQ